MPRGDRTGPLGEGPMTGRQLGYGAGYNSPGYIKSRGFAMGRRFFNRLGFGWGYGGGFRNRGYMYDPAADYFPGYGEHSHSNEESKANEIETLKSEVKKIGDYLKQITDRLDMLTSRKDEK